MKTIRLKLKERLTLMLLASSLVLTGAKCDQDEIETKVWMHDSEDSTLYRKVGKDEEFFRCDQREIEQFVCVTKEDFLDYVNGCRRRKR